MAGLKPPPAAVDEVDLSSLQDNNEVLGECMKRLYLFSSLKSISMPTRSGSRIRVERMSGGGLSIHFDVGIHK